MRPIALESSSAARAAHLASADGKENGAPALGNGTVVLLHGGVEGFAGAVRLAHQGLRLLELRPDACGLCMHAKTS